MFFGINDPAALMFNWHAVWIAAAVIVLGIPAVLFAVAIFGRVAQRRRGVDQRALPPAADETELDRAIWPVTKQHRGQSGLMLLPGNMQAFNLRHETARLAGRSLDLMYYFWKGDLTGRLLARQIVLAADRGVRVRLLLDDINAFGFDRTYLALDSHPNIEVRMFNPSRSRTDAFRRGIELIAKYFTATRRMHNKCWIADGQLIIAGGRNIGDEYFDASDATNFQDIDVLGVGPCVADAADIFDRYWNSEAALPIRILHKIRRPRLAKLVLRLSAFCATGRARTFLYAAKCASASAAEILPLDSLHWAEDVTVMADPPEKAKGIAQPEWLGERINALLRQADKSLRIISPYFIPGTAGSKTLSGLAARGVDVRVLTNSLAATDVLAVHGAYARYRRRLVESGIRLFELKPEPGRHRASLFGSRTASLHTKAIVKDMELGFVGSFNLDPRSHSINTEMGVVFRSPGLVKELAQIFEAQTMPEISYALAEDGGRLVWRDLHEGETRAQTGEPDAPFRRRFPAALIAWLPIESQL